MGKLHTDSSSCCPWATPAGYHGPSHAEAGEQRHMRLHYGCGHWNHIHGVSCMGRSHPVFGYLGQGWLGGKDPHNRIWPCAFKIYMHSVIPLNYKHGQTTPMLVWNRNRLNKSNILFDYTISTLSLGQLASVCWMHATVSVCAQSIYDSRNSRRTSRMRTKLNLEWGRSDHTYRERQHWQEEGSVPRHRNIQGQMAESDQMGSRDEERECKVAYQHVITNLLNFEWPCKSAWQDGEMARGISFVIRKEVYLFGVIKA